MESASEEWKAYVNLIDDLVAKGFTDSIMCSLKFFLDNIGMLLNNSRKTHSHAGSEFIHYIVHNTVRSLIC